MIKAKKRFGQNFLRDESFLNRIVESMPNSDNIIVEIGPGLGDLTKKIFVKRDAVKAFEVDTDLCKILKNLFSSHIDESKLELICGDILDIWQRQNLIEQNYDLVANLPYYIATKLILKALEDENCKNITVMVQKEVADKFCAVVSDRNFSSLSILTGLIGESRINFLVPPSAFEPPPKVTSAVFTIEKNKNYYGVNGVFEDEKEFREFQYYLRIAFIAPRKTLIKNLSSKYEKSVLVNIFTNFSLQSNIRPHQLCISNYYLIFKELKGKTDGPIK